MTKQKGKRENYFFLHYNGTCLPPTAEEVRDSDISNSPFILIPDSNVCGNLLRNYSSEKNKLEWSKVYNFLKYCKDSNITIVPAYALLERASNPGSLEINIDRLASSEAYFWNKLGHDVTHNELSSIVSSLNFLKPLLHPFYAYILKIKLIISKRSSSKDYLKKNLREMLEFSDCLGLNSLLPWQFAIALFGGYTELNKFLSPKKEDGGDIFKSLWRASWDLVYLQLISQYNGIREERKGIFPRYIFVTDEKSCSTIANFPKVVGILETKYISYNAVSLNCDVPHFNTDTNSGFISEINSEMQCLFESREKLRKSMSELDMQKHIEEIVDRASNLIVELTKEIKEVQASGKKGFG